MSSHSNGYGEVIDASTVRIERRFRAPLEKVWRYLTDSELRATWLAPGPMELRVGGAVELQFDFSKLTPEPTPEKYRQYNDCAQHGAVTRCEPPNLLAFTWGGEGDDPPSEVVMELAADGDLTRLTVTHRRLPNRDEMISVSTGWHTHLSLLEEALHGTARQSFWTTHTVVEAHYRQQIR